MSNATPDLDYRRKFVTNPTTVAVTASAVLSGTLDAGCQYWVFNSGTIAAYFLQGTGSVSATAGISNPVAAGAFFPDPIFVDTDSNRVSAVATLVSGTLFLVKKNS